MQKLFPQAGCKGDSMRWQEMGNFHGAGFEKIGFI
jgi:hypothetical protein